MTATWNTIRQTIAQQIVNNWGSFAIPQVAENIPFESTGTTYTRWSIRPILAENAAVDTTYERVTAFLWFQIFIPVTQGSKPAYDCADHIKSIFNNLILMITVGPTNIRLWFHVADLGYIGIDTLSGNDQWRCRIYFEADSNPP
jgi:hypothetical protein